jgi:VacB/RNase II family 3'-5' exoribonuclease
MHQDELTALARDAMLQRGLQPDFPGPALAQLQGLAPPATQPGHGVRDQRDLPWSSIDNDDSRDLDQLTVAIESPGGAVRVLVAIADVDALVAQGTPLDAHAAANTTSVYTAAKVFPMLPELLSTDLTSLNEAENRLAVVVDMSIADDGRVVDSDVYRAVVRSQAKLAYNSVAAWLDGRADAPERVRTVPGIEHQLRLQDRVAQTLKSLRASKGSLNLSTPQARPVFDQGVLTDLRVDDKNRAKELISDFMIAANGVTARFLERAGFPSIRRVLHAPRRWERIVMLAAEHGQTLPSEPDSIALDAFLSSQRKARPQDFDDLSLTVVKLLGSGEYAVAAAGRGSEGHFGLAVSDYAHSTAPNRRFPDLVTQRLIKAALDGRPAPYGEAELGAIAQHCTQQEDMAAKVERQIRKSAAAMLLGERIGDSFAAIVTGRSDKGTWVRISQPVAEGRVVRGFEGLDVGDKPRVRLASVDVARGFIDFERV